MEEPSVLDYLKAKLTPWRGPAPRIPALEPQEELERGDRLRSDVRLDLVPDEVDELEPALTPETTPSSVKRPWKILLALCLALIAQITLEPGPERTWIIGFILYLLATVVLVWAVWRSEWLAFSTRQDESRISGEDTKSFATRPLSLLLALPIVLLAFLAFSGNLFTTLNVFLWLLAIFLVVRAFWIPTTGIRSWWYKVRDSFVDQQWRFSLSPSTLLFLAVIAVVVFFRVYRLAQVPPEMVSDHAEKLLDVWDVLHDQPRIFFPRNTGREALQMYITAAIILVFGTGYSFSSLKIGTFLAGLLTLPFIYLLGKEVGNRRVGLLAMIFAGIAYWPNVISRVGLRFPLYPLFVAPALYFLLRGLRTMNRNDFILSGLALGIGLHGYTPIRILPIVIIIAIVLYMLHRQSKGNRKQVLKYLSVLMLVALIVFLPLSRYALEDPVTFSYRTFSRIGSIERALPGPAWQIFLGNLWKALTMFVWDNGEIWVHSVAHRPALDVVSAALFTLGIVLMLVRFLRQRNWLDLFLLLSAPLLMLPSILSLAFPAENPSLNRMGGAIIPVFLIIAIALDAVLGIIESGLGQKTGKGFAWALVILLLVLSAYQNYDLVFNQFQTSYKSTSWNTSEMGQVIRDFTNLVGDPNSAYVVAYPHWVDTRLVGIIAGYTLKDYAIWPDAFLDTLSNQQAKLFLIKIEDIENIDALRELYPQGVLQKYVSQVESHNFFMFFVPPQG